MGQPKLKIKKGDKVIVISGSHKGATGEVLKVMPTENRAIVQNVAMVKRHKKPTQMAAGGIEEKERAINISNLALADPKMEKPTRVGYKMLDSGKKVRVARKSGETIE